MKQLDTLKISAYGVKNPTHIKEQTKNLGDKTKQYYPKDKEGNYDEWAAVEKTQHETATKMHQAQEKGRRALMANEYGKGQYEQGLAKTLMA